MSSLNRVQLIGRVGADPEIRALKNGGKCANMSIATSDRWKDRNTGEKREATQWHRVVVWADGLITIIERYVKKGSLIMIEGRLETRKWQDQSGQDKYTTEVVLKPYDSKLILLGGNNNDDQSGSFSSQNYNQPMQSEPQGLTENNYSDIDDDIPF